MTDKNPVAAIRPITVLNAMSKINDLRQLGVDPASCNDMEACVRCAAFAAGITNGEVREAAKSISDKYTRENMMELFT